MEAFAPLARRSRRGARSCGRWIGRAVIIDQGAARGFRGRYHDQMITERPVVCAERTDSTHLMMRVTAYGLDVKLPLVPVIVKV